MAKYSRTDLKDFHIQHPESHIVYDVDTELLVGLWGPSDVRFDLNEMGDQAENTFNHISIDSRLDGIFHLDSNHMEFAYTYLDANDEDDAPIIDRRFTVNFRGNDFECWFGEPSDRMFALARAFRRTPTLFADQAMRQLRIFRDAQRLENLPQNVQRFFEGKIPRNFFVDLSASPDMDIASLARHINLLIRYYDRRSPVIEIRSPNLESNEIPRPTRYIIDQFPERLNAREIDEVLLTLLEVARTSDPRSAFLYYYQVFEYAGHYFIDDKARKSLKRLLRDPSLANCDDRKVAELFSVVADLHHHDEQRMQHVVDDHCDPKHLWPDIQNDLEFFSSVTEFDGGLQIERLVSPNATEDTWRDAFKGLFQTLKKIRNCIVHAREKRESKVILPTRSNDEKISRYIPIIRRMAEDVATLA